MSVVVDASLIVALVVPDERQAAAQAHLEGWLESGEKLHAPAVLPYEIADVLARLVFDGDLEIGGIAETWSDLAALGVELHHFDLVEDGPSVAAITAQLRCRHATDGAPTSTGRTSRPRQSPRPARPCSPRSRSGPR